MFKVRQCCSAMEDQDIQGEASRGRPKLTLTIIFCDNGLMPNRTCDQGFICAALKETDHMSRVDMLHCAVCHVYISTSETSVKNHVASMKHVHSKKVCKRPSGSLSTVYH